MSKRNNVIYTQIEVARPTFFERIGMHFWRLQFRIKRILKDFSEIDASNEWFRVCDLQKEVFTKLLEMLSVSTGFFCEICAKGNYNAAREIVRTEGFRQFYSKEMRVISSKLFLETANLLCCFFDEVLRSIKENFFLENSFKQKVNTCFTLIYRVYAAAFQFGYPKANVFDKHYKAVQYLLALYKLGEIES